MRKRKCFITAVLAILITAGAFLCAPGASALPEYKPSEGYMSSKYYTALTEYKLTGDQRYDTVALALTQLGYHEGDSELDFDGMNTMGGKNFVEYNRIYGTEKADEVLFAVANCVKIISKPKTDIICRYEGDTILVCLTVKADKDAIVLSEEIRSAVKDMKIPFPEASRYRNITATVSAARGMPGDTYDDIYVRAMRSQSVAKRIGGNCIAFKEHTFRPDGEK